MQQFSVARYYATPTVLIIDPSSGQVINNEDRHQWGNAYKIDVSTSVRYFEKWLKDAADADSVEEPVVDSARLRRLYAQIDEFEQQLANRVTSVSFETMRAAACPQATRISRSCFPITHRCPGNLNRFCVNSRYDAGLLRQKKESNVVNLGA